MRIMKKKKVIAAGILMALLLAGCGQENGKAEKNTDDMATEEDAAQAPGEKQAQENGTEPSESPGGALGESAQDGEIDFSALLEKNPDIFAWLYIPGTGIDTPVLQSPVSDDYYKSHNVEGNDDDKGAPFTEMPNMMNMCDFNTIIHGKDLAEKEPFFNLHNFENPDFFEKNREFYIYLPDNVLTYEVLAAFYDEGSDILRRHDYTTYEGCQDYLKELTETRSMGKNMKEGWEDLTPYHFLVTLDGSLRENDTQYVVIGILTGDAAGKIDRVIYE